MLEKGITAIQNPRKVPEWGRRKLREGWQTVYPKYVRMKGGTVQKNCQGSVLELSTDDGGLSTDLICFGIREPHTTRAYRRELRRLDQQKNGPITILEVGANIGYYAFIPVAELGDTVRVIAIEAEERNVRHLERNIELNGYSGQIEVVPKAGGRDEKTVELTRSTHLNRHSIQPGFATENPNLVADSVEVDVQPVETILSDRGITPGEIDVVRMDVEGYEADVFRGMESIFEHSDDLLIQIEIHPVLMSRDDNEYLMHMLEDQDVNVISSAQDWKNLNVTTLKQAFNKEWVELVLR